MSRIARCLCLGLLAACGSPPREVDDAALRSAAGDTSSWLTYGRTLDEQRFSPLQAVNEQTVGQLAPAWVYMMPTTRAHESTPLVHDGTMYVTSAWSVLHALDAGTGAEKWTFDPKVPRQHAKFACCDVVNRGAALYRGKVYVGTLDGRLVAVDATTGTLAWEVPTTPPGSAYTITGAPRIARGLVLIGNGGAEYGVRGYVSAFDAETGQLAWRTYTVPGDPSQPFESEAMRVAAKTWAGEWWKAGGGGTAWDAIVYDPDLDLVYVGTGNGSPWYRRLRSADQGDNLYLSSILALRATTGEQVWHFQTTPGDNWDYTATQPLMLADLEIGGAVRKVILQAPKNGFFYVIDRATGAFISARPFAAMNWATGVDSTGRPIENPAARAPSALVMPHTNGAHNWNPMSYSPRTGFVYLPVLDATALHLADTTWRYDPQSSNEGFDSARLPTWNRGANRDAMSRLTVSGRLVAWDPVRQREAWRVEHPDPRSGGTLATAGGLVFQGRADGRFRAYRATDGAVMWEYPLGIGMLAAPISHAVDGEQYVAILAGYGGPAVLRNNAIARGRIGRGMLKQPYAHRARLTGAGEPPVLGRPTHARPIPPARGQSGAATTRWPGSARP